jgi:hypothetical protein
MKTLHSASLLETRNNLISSRIFCRFLDLYGSFKGFEQQGRMETISIMKFRINLLEIHDPKIGPLSVLILIDQN